MTLIDLRISLHKIFDGQPLPPPKKNGHSFDNSVINEATNFHKTLKMLHCNIYCYNNSKLGFILVHLPSRAKYLKISHADSQIQNMYICIT